VAARLSWAALAVALVGTAWIGYASYGRSYRQPTTITESIWPDTGLYFGQAAVAGAYRARGRLMSRRWRRGHSGPGQARIRRCSGRRPALRSCSPARPRDLSAERKT
jgi:hypothetical protein